MVNNCCHGIGGLGSLSLYSCLPLCMADINPIQGVDVPPLGTPSQ